MGISQSNQNEYLEKLLGDDFPKNTILVGFENNSNNCYSNVILQALYYCKVFRIAILQYSSQQDNLITLTKTLFQQIQSSKHKTGVLSIKKMMNYIKTKNKIFDSRYHQDCHEFYVWYINECEEILNGKNKQKKNETNWLQQIFQGHLITKTQCLTCQTISERDETYYNLSLDLEANCSLSRCIANLQQEESLKDANQFFCDKCNSKQDATKRQELGGLPKILVIHLKRFKYDEKYNAMIKIGTKIPFTNRMKVKDNYFELTAIIVHLGQGIQYGHYICLIRIENKWYKFDDDKISIFADQDMHIVFGRSFQNPALSSAYMLFYVKI